MPVESWHRRRPRRSVARGRHRSDTIPEDHPADCAPVLLPGRGSNSYGLTPRTIAFGLDLLDYLPLLSGQAIHFHRAVRDAGVLVGLDHVEDVAAVGAEN